MLSSVENNLAEAKRRWTEKKLMWLVTHTKPFFARLLFLAF